MQDRKQNGQSKGIIIDWIFGFEITGFFRTQYDLENDIKVFDHNHFKSLYFYQFLINENQF